MKASTLIGALVVHLAFGATTASSDVDPVVACRTAHGSDPAAHIDCLERALNARNPKLGAEQVRTARREAEDNPKQVEVQIASVSYSDDGRGLFQMTDGQLWSETERSPKGLRLNPGQQYSARIQRGTLGGYRMHVDGMRRMIKVERLK